MVCGGSWTLRSVSASRPGPLRNFLFGSSFGLRVYQDFDSHAVECGLRNGIVRDSLSPERERTICAC